MNHSALIHSVRLLVLVCWLSSMANGQDKPTFDEVGFKEHVAPAIKKFCVRCHNPDNMESGIRVDQLSAVPEDRQLFLLKGIQKQIDEEAMPPKDEPQLSAEQRRLISQWITRTINAARSKETQRNGAVRRLTVAQYRNTLRDLLGLQEDLTDSLPPDGLSKDGFANNAQLMQLAPLQVETYFDIADKALGLCLVDEKTKPVVQTFRMEFGTGINPTPCPDRLILGANNELLANADFIVTEPKPAKPFEFQPFAMRTKYDFIEGYVGNDTIRAWKKFDSIYHSVFACVRGTPGYPKGLATQVVPSGLLLRPAIPSPEIFGQSNTYGPMANFKISLRELPEHGNFRVTVKAARYDDGLLLEPKTETLPDNVDGAVTWDPPTDLKQSRAVMIPRAGIYQVDLHEPDEPPQKVETNAARLKDGLVGAWHFDGDANPSDGRSQLVGRLVGDAKFVKSPFGQAVSLDGNDDEVVIPHHESMHVGEGDFTVTAWIHPKQLRQAGIVVLGKYGWTHGWILDIPDNQGVLRLETANSNNQSNGTVQSPPRVLRANTWQHVAVVVRRKGETRLFVNGFLVASGTIGAANLDNPKLDLHVGRVPDVQQFNGEIDEVHFYRRALENSELQALMAPGRQFLKAPRRELANQLTLQLGDRHFTGAPNPAFLAVRLPAGELPVTANQSHRVVFSPLADEHPITQRFKTFEKRSPSLGVHVGLRRDCGSTLNPVHGPQPVKPGELQDFIFEGAINDFPTPDVEKDNVNYLAGIREIGVRSEYTDGRDMPRVLVKSIEFEGPYYVSWPPPTHRRIFIESAHPSDSLAYAEDIIRSFANRAFRRPVTLEELAPIVAVWKESYTKKKDFQRAIKDALLVVLTSPQFLFLIENSSSPASEDLDGFELASKLSYFLWNAPPDDRLLELAAKNSLHQSLDAEIDRLIHDARFGQFINEFASQWLSLDKFDVVSVDMQRYPKLTRDTKTQLRQEPVQFVRHLIEHNLPLRNLVQSDFVIANEVTANYYGLADRTESGFGFVAIKHENPQLGGVLTQAGILSGLSDGRESNPIKRGAWLARKIVAEPPDDPPPNVPRLDEEDRQLTLREKLERHRNQKGCAKCHSGIDPWGLPFESFDASGLMKKTPDIDPRSKLPDGTEVKDLNGLKAYLANERLDQVAFSFLKHTACYALGRSLTYNEIMFLKEHSTRLKGTDYRTQDLLKFVVKSDLFLKK